MIQLALVFGPVHGLRRRRLPDQRRPGRRSRPRPPGQAPPPSSHGQVPVPLAYATGGVLAVLAPTAAALLSSPVTAALLTAYLGMQLAYCVSLKHVPGRRPRRRDDRVPDAGDDRRARPRHPALRWFLITTGFGALFMVAAKRYCEAVQLGGNAGATRALLTEYTTGYLRFVWQLAAGVAVLAYCLWALEEGGAPSAGVLPWRQLSMVAFILAVLRYAVFADRGAAGEPEDVVLRDRALALIGLVSRLAMSRLAVVNW